MRRSVEKAKGEGDGGKDNAANIDVLGVNFTDLSHGISSTSLRSASYTTQISKLRNFLTFILMLSRKGNQSVTKFKRTRWGDGIATLQRRHTLITGKLSHLFAFCTFLASSHSADGKLTYIIGIFSNEGLYRSLRNYSLHRRNVERRFRTIIHRKPLHSHRIQITTRHAITNKLVV